MRIESHPTSLQPVHNKHASRSEKPARPADSAAYPSTPPAPLPLLDAAALRPLVRPPAPPRPKLADAVEARSTAAEAKESVRAEPRSAAVAHGGLSPEAVFQLLH